MLIYPFSEAKAILERCAEIEASAPDELTFQLGFAAGPDGAPVVFIVPTWCGAPEQGEARVAPFLKLGTLLAGTVDVMPYRALLTVFDPYVVNGQRIFMETCWLPALDSSSINVFIQAMETAASPGCTIFTHQFKGAATRVPAEETDITMTSKVASPSEILDVFGPRIQHLTVLSDADDGYCLIGANFPAGVVVPIHSHDDRETFYMIAGELQGLWEDHWISVAGGDVFDVPGGIRHAWRNVSGVPASLLVVTTVRLGRFFRDIGRPIATVPVGPPTPADLQRFFEIAHDYGYWFGSAADNAAVGITFG
jgi:quercetin dioxygenase-like cupin family protein